MSRPLRPQVDLVRSSLTFDTANGLAECLERIAADPSVAVLHVKNRLRPDYDSARSAGYRNVALSLIVVDDGSRWRTRASDRSGLMVRWGWRVATSA